MRDNPTPTYVANPAGTEGDHGRPKASLKTRAIGEAKKFAIMTLYLWIFFAVLSLHKTIILEQNKIDVTEQSLAIVNALVLAKIMLIADDLKLGRRFKDHSLSFSVLWNSFAFAVVLIIFHILEHAAIALVKGRPLASSLADFGAGNLRGVLSMGAIAFVALIPFFGFQEIARVVGSDALWQLFFTRGRKTFRLLVQE
jgi:hypothetical protein